MRGPAVRHHGRCGSTGKIAQNCNNCNILQIRMHAQALLFATVVNASFPGSGVGTLRVRMHLMLPVSRPDSAAGTVRARMHLMLAVSCPGSGLGTLRARRHLIFAVSRPGSGLGTLRARMHLMLAVSNLGCGLGTLRARMHAQTLLCATTAAASYISTTGAVVGRMNASALLLTLTSAASCTSSAVAARTLPPAPQPDACHEQPQGQHWPHVTPRQTHGLLQTRAEKSIVAVACVATCVSANQSAEELHGSATSGCIISLSGVCDVARSSFSR